MSVEKSSINTDDIIETDDIIDIFNTFIDNIKSLCNLSAANNNFDASCSVDTITGDKIPLVYPSDDFGSFDDSYKPIVSKNTVINATSLCNTFIQCANNYFYIRHIKTYWYHKSGNNYAIQYESNDKYAILLNRKIEKRDKTTYTYNGISLDIENTAHAKKEITDYKILNENISKNTLIEKKDLIDAVDKLYIEWKQTVDKYPITYNIYTCHWNCHSNWSSSRSRR